VPAEEIEETLADLTRVMAGAGIKTALAFIWLERPPVGEPST
jgi:hypothetical protein